jgi:hypothetical protein
VEALLAVRHAQHHVAQFAHIAGIVACHQLLHDLGHHARRRAGVLGQEVFDQQRDVVAPRRQRRGVDGPLGDAEVQVAAEAACCHLRVEAAVGRAGQPEVRAPPVVVAHALVGALLHHAQQAGLQQQVQFADFVEEQCAAIGQRHGAVTRGHGVGEGAARMAEQLAAG